LNIDSDAVICFARAVRKDMAWMRDILQLRSGEELLVGPCIVAAIVAIAAAIVVVAAVAIVVSA
jgi:hypothetical protein